MKKQESTPHGLPVRHGSDKEQDGGKDVKREKGPRHVTTDTTSDINRPSV